MGVVFVGHTEPDATSAYLHTSNKPEIEMSLANHATFTWAAAPGVARYLIVLLMVTYETQGCSQVRDIVLKTLTETNT